MPREPKKPVEVDDDDDKIGSFLDELPEANDPRVDDDDDDDEGNPDEGDEPDDEGDEPDDEPLDERPAAPVRAQVPAASSPARRPAPVSPRPPPAKAPRAPRPRALSADQVAESPGFGALKRATDSAYQQVDEILASLNFASREYRVRLERLAPHKTPDGIDCSGFLEEFTDNVTTADIKSSYGGGTFSITIFGPHPITNRPSNIKQERFKIAGPSKMPLEHDNVARARELAERTRKEEENVVTQKFIEAQERQQERYLELLQTGKDKPDIVEKIVPIIAPLLKELVAKGDESMKTMMALQQAEREERRREEDRRREDDRRRDEERRREEDRREERRREEERARREEEKEERRREEARRAEEREERRREEEQRREDERQRREDEREARRREDEEKRRMYELQLAQANDRQKFEREQQQAQMKMVQDGAAQQQALLMQSFQFQVETISKRAESGGLESLAKQMLMLNDLKNNITGEGQGGDSSTMDRVMEVGERFFIPLAQQLANRRSNVQVQPPQPQPGRAVVVDLGPKQPTQPQLPAGQPAAPAPAPVENPGTPPAAPVDELRNDLTSLTPPNGSEDLMTGGTLLLKNIDFAVQNNWSAEDVVEKILDIFEQRLPLLMNMAGGLDEPQLMAFLEGNVPANWAVRTPRGEDLVREAFSLWKDDSDDDEEEVA